MSLLLYNNDLFALTHGSSFLFFFSFWACSSFVHGPNPPCTEESKHVTSLHALHERSCAWQPHECHSLNSLFGALPLTSTSSFTTTARAQTHLGAVGKYCLVASDPTSPPTSLKSGGSLPLEERACSRYSVPAPVLDQFGTEGAHAPGCSLLHVAVSRLARQTAFKRFALFSHSSHDGNPLFFSLSLSLRTGL